jgi:hypothetical protein
VTRAEVAVVLGLAAARDYRRVGEADVLAWHEDIGDLDFDDARAAVSRHYRESTDRLMPAHVRRIVRDIHAERRRQQPNPARALPSRFEDDAARSVRLARGAATCREVLAPLLRHLAGDTPTNGALEALRAMTTGPDWPDTTQEAR